MAIKFGDRLKELRESRKLTQLELANMFNVHKTTISNWEKGKRFPDEEILNKLADYFNISMNYLLGKEAKNDIKSKSINDMTEMVVSTLVRRLIDERVITKEGEFDDKTMNLIKAAIKIDAQLSSNLKDATD